MLLLPRRENLEIASFVASVAPPNMGGDTLFHDLAGWVLPAMDAQQYPVLLRLVIPYLQIGSATTVVSFQVVNSNVATGTAATAANAWMSRDLYFGVAFAVGSPTWERRIPAGTALPALKVRYKTSNAVANSATWGAAAVEGVFGRFEQILRK